MSVLFLKMRLAKWIMCTAFSLLVTVKPVFCLEPLGSVYLQQTGKSPLQLNFHMGIHPLFAEIFLFTLRTSKQNTSGHFKSKHPGLLTALFKGVSGVGLVHSSRI